MSALRLHALLAAAAAPVALLAAGCCACAVDLSGDARFADASWDDGMAVVQTFEGRVRRYGEWRDAVVRDYMVREYLDPDELTKRDAPTPSLVPVLKANRTIEFATGSYDYRLTTSLFFRRDTGRLVKGVGCCANACGIVFERWDAPSSTLRSDSYWEHEGRAEAPLDASQSFFADELPFVANAFTEGERIRVLPPLASPHSILQPQRARPIPGAETAWLGIGDLCTECVLPPEGERDPRYGDLAAGPPRVPERELVVKREGKRVRLLDLDGTLALELAYDELGFLEGWTLPNEQEFRRARAFRGPYWERTHPADRALVEP